ncbi:MAG: hypothetical protein K2M41_09270 [Muribaculaceae bacterium]|nr:hypothetical protein [Muribaculaceae bacterium]
MKKLSIICAMAALALGFTSCKQEDNPQYKDPTTFTINEPALKEQAFRTAKEMTDPETFNLFASQPDYGYSAVCNYSALVSLDPEAPLDEWIELTNTLPTSGAMAIQTFELGAAINVLLNVEDEADFNNRGLANEVFAPYFRAVCEIPGIEGSRIVSSNMVQYNKVMIQYAEKKPGWIYICGDVANITTGKANGFTAPGVANEAAYMENWSLFEPEDMIGQKLYVGVFNLTPKETATAPEYTGNPDDCAQFRFFTQLLGWTTEASLGSNEADFYCEPITDKVDAGYTGDIVPQGLGNWGVYVTEPTPVTIVVDVNENKIYVKLGEHNVTFLGRTPEFE